MYLKKNFNYIKLLIIISLLIIFNIFSPISFASSHAQATSINISASTAILMEYDTGKIIYNQGAQKRMYPASTTKIMTAILTLENCKLDDKATVSYEAVTSVPSGYTNANLQVDEVLTINDLLHILLIPSANDAANVLAEHIAGSIESFSSMMNTKAIELGCKDTNFVNPSGIHNDNHYSTAYDLALMAKYAMKFDIFNEIVNTTKCTLPTSNKYDKTDRTFTTTNHLIINKSKDYYQYATGLKTGYTNAAKNCLVSSAKKDNIKLISVVLGCENDKKFSDTKQLFEYGFSNYSLKNVINANEVFKSISPKHSSKESPSLNVLYENSINIFIENSTDISNISPTVEFNEELTAPIKKGNVLGKVSYNVDGIIYETNLIAGQDIYSDDTISLILKILAIVLLLYIFASLGFKNNDLKKSRKKGKH